MKREIKFRAKRKDNRQWVYGFYFKTPLTAEFHAKDGNYFSSNEIRDCISTIEGVVFEIDRKTLGQFTGIKDVKSQKEIYEDDIVIYPKVTYDIDEQGEDTEDVIDIKGRVIFSNGEFSHSKSEFGWEGEGLIRLNGCTVIGNIFDNKKYVSEL